MDKKNLQYALITIVLAISVIGIVFIGSITMPLILKDPVGNGGMFIKHLIIVAMAVAASFALYKVLLENRKKFMNPNKALEYTIIGICIFLLLLPLAFPAVKGAHRWIRLPGFTLQPSEIVKPIFIILLASVYYRYRRDEQNTIVNFLGITAIFFLAIWLEKSKTSALQYALIGYLMFCVTTARQKIKFGIAGIGSLSFILLLILSRDYSWQRIVSFGGDKVHPQVAAALSAIKTGNITGLGIGDGLHKYFYLSEAHNDYMFAAISEEGGFIWAIIIILLFMSLIFILFYIAFSLNSFFNKYIVFGVAFNIANQIVVHIAINLNLSPSTGITLPFISYGGSSFIANTMCIALVLFAINSDKKGEI
ncbi:FtsW/RodA/SpoVE family cell cycle protein [Oceanivirga salmonicida]|uniref:FtsW/RodA/SpoVE family cell cycle protein n=1 Tax=Oceanivirga salmonicida TaxID=1769291 RepID=UPI000829EC50|nr:FtsW/RodA/SpoVE family cell cycle protein [Oceanivirga salmonicida]